MKGAAYLSKRTKLDHGMKLQPIKKSKYKTKKKKSKKKPIRGY